MIPGLSDPRKYIEVTFAQAAKKVDGVCGDYIVTDRTSEATTTIVADGIGTGIKARVAAVMCASRLMELLRLGFSLREACRKIVDTMHQARTADIPFAAFAVCRVLVSGHATIMSYEIPGPILINNRLAAYLPKQRFFPFGHEMIAEVTCMLEYGDAVVLVSDGVSQAGLGSQYRMGWGMAGVCGFVNSCLARGINPKDVPPQVLGKVRDISHTGYGDDTTCLSLYCREARALNILTGPPLLKSRDAKVVNGFIKMPGLRVICGSTTSEMAGRVLNAPVKIKGLSDGYHNPPAYEIGGVDFATEGAVTLNQLYNILEEDPDCLAQDSSVSALSKLFHASDTINFIVGTAVNPGHESLVFRQMGVFPRAVIVRLLEERLKKMGKVVNVEYA